MGVLLTVENLEIGYRRKRVLSDVNMEILKGNCIGILGTNGCGKSTLLKTIAGIKRISKGKIIWHDEGIKQKEVGYMPQECPLIPELTVKDNLLFWYSNRTRLELESKEGFLAKLELEKEWKTPVRKLSGGMKKRVSLACAMANHPTLLILDEPGSNIDILCKQNMQEYMQEYQRTGGTILLATHDESEIRLCDKIYFIHEGKIKEITNDRKSDSEEGCHREKIQKSDIIQLLTGNSDTSNL